MTDDGLTPEQALEAAIKQDLGVGSVSPETPTDPAVPAGETVVEAAKEEERPSVPEAPPSWTPRERTFKHNGQDITFKPSSEEEELSLIRQGYDYTRKTMDLARQREQLERATRDLQAQDQARQQELRNLLYDKERLRTYLNALEGTTGAPPQGGPAPPASPEDDEFVSRAEAKRMSEEAASKAERAARAAAEKVAKEHADAMKQEIEISQLSTAYKADFDRTIDKLIRTDFPVLQEFGPPDMADRLKAEGQMFLEAQTRLNPGMAVDPAAIKAAMQDAARRWSDFYEGRIREREKRFATAQAQVTQRGLEPRGGQAPPPPPQGKMKLNDPKLDELVLQEIQSIMGR